MAQLPADHPLRRSLADEVHARPPAAVSSPAVASILAVSDAPAESVLDSVIELAHSNGVESIVTPHAAHAIVELPALRIKWERHGEFSSLTLVAPAPVATPDEVSDAAYPSAFDMVPTDWLARLPGRVIAAADILVLPFGADAPRPDALHATLRPRCTGRFVDPRRGRLGVHGLRGATERAQPLADARRPHESCTDGANGTAGH